MAVPQKIDPQSWKEDLAAFRQKTEEFYAGNMDKMAYKGFSGLYGSYAQRGGKANMLRLRMTAGRVTPEKLAFTADAVRRHQVSRLHFTTCQTIQLHDLQPDAVFDIMEKALDAGIVTLGGGGDYPRNVMCSPLAGVEEGEYFDVLPWAEAAGDYLMHFIKAEKMPRKLKVGFSSTAANIPHATYRDLGFVARADGKFDVYSAGGLGNNPRFGVKVAQGIDPEKVELPSMMIQIPVENALKHGLRQKAGEKLLAISVVRQSDSIVIRIEDNGVGFRVQAGNQDLQSTGTGLRVLNQTIQLLNARNAEAITLRVKKSLQGTDEYPGCLVEVTLPDHYSYFLPEK